MRCPVDRSFMVSRQQGTVLYDYCPACGGMWFERDALAVIDVPGAPAGPLVSMSVPTTAGAAAGRQERRLPCRHCMEPLVTRKLGDAEVDVCARCGGVWLDAGELTRVAESYRRWFAAAGAESSPLPGEPAAPLASCPAQAIDEASYMFDLALNALGLAAKLGLSLAFRASGKAGGSSGGSFGGDGGFAGGGSGREF